MKMINFNGMAKGHKIRQKYPKIELPIFKIFFTDLLVLPVASNPKRKKALSVPLAVHHLRVVAISRRIAALVVALARVLRVATARPHRRRLHVANALRLRNLSLVACVFGKKF